jgi:prepilin peptidase CpaA
MSLPATAAFWLLVFATPICLWVAWSDLKSMRIPNKAVLALIAVFAVVGLFTLPLSSWAWGWAHLAVVLVIGFVLTLTGAVGAGDAKFAAAMAPFIALADLRDFVMILAATTVASLIAHRLVRRSSVLRGLAPDWTSWTHKAFPMGLALGPSLIFYLGRAVLYGI